MGRRHQRGGGSAGPPGQARHRVGRVEPGTGRHQLREADLLRPRSACVRPVLDAADRALVKGRQPLRLRVRRGRRRSPGGVRQRAAQHLRRQPAGDRQPRPVRPLARDAACVRAAEDRRGRHQQRPVHPAAVPGGDQDPAIGGHQDRLQQGVPGRGHRLCADRDERREHEGRCVPAGLRRRADGVGLHPHVHPAALQPQGLHRDRRSRSGSGVPEGDRRAVERRGSDGPERLVSGLRQRRQPEDGPGICRQVRRQPVGRERRRRRGLLGGADRRPGRRRDA